MRAESSYFSESDQAGFNEKMPNATPKKIIRLLGVGFDAEDGHIRITKGDNYDVLMGSDESHEYMQQLIRKIEDALAARNLSLDDFTPDQFLDFVKNICEL
ncbi:hypothetical protein [Pontiella agarivorans]|uniref:Uncharacterized protein n=1 Tax=Pontiella agarivorans TaxID=3038953 RepID=A0ABU5MWY4_9BACT|nr:hypothetical protein [Pontiella agarivorans]MDZ8118576.1 hypothetical protein [Pontiella agarivorans]